MTESSKRRRTKPSVARIIGWGGSAAVALVAAVFASQTETGATRLETALLGTDSAPAAGQIDQVDRAAQTASTVPRRAGNGMAAADIRRLTEQVRDLTADRDRLAARLASLERQLSDTTGSIGSQPASAAPEPAAAAPFPSGPSPEEAVSEKPNAEMTPAFIINPDVLPKLAAIVIPVNDTPAVIEPLSMPGAPANDAILAEPAKPVSEPAPAADKPATVQVPLPPVRVAVAPPAPKPPAPPRLEYAVDLGGSITTGNIAAQWRAVKANLGPALTGLRPAVGRDHRFGHVPYRLIVGPFANPAAAARLCERLDGSGLECRPTRFEGEKLAQF